ncbi:glycosyltransferase family 1 protein [Rhodanobacter sp. AS-Z3]|uniref:glycosyltransferase family 4 protein n=1 Tax=Rhodanobacter sp. AS-Z3 TaxID=3031330 RepID=UPI00247A3EC5|nr:glycosyltransferase family 1 protein [Rhodanobacter sp. AS-Z3]WEN14949.1 glycosyltransferase family 1 protein [Rhodanobacter sp. AS-Z3]
MHIVLDLQACQSPESRRRGIGRYSLALAKAMAANPRGHDITILLNAAMGESVEFLRGQFDSVLPQERIHTWEALTPTACVHPDNAFRMRASEVLRMQTLRQLKPDVVHVASLFEGLADDVIATIPGHEAHLGAITLYDLIPLAHEETYLCDPRVRRWYMEKVGHLRRADVLLGISRFSCDEASELLEIPADRLTDISGAADDIFMPLESAESFRQELMCRYSLQRPFIMYAGGFDARKNIDALIRAFALMPSALRCKHQLVIVGGAPAPEREALESLAMSLGLSGDEVVFVGYVPDRDLVKLYNLCALYVFPSLQEGFGLPALEAMSSGAIVIGSNTSSLPEVIGREDALFDPRNDGAIAGKMIEALTDDSFRVSLREHGRKQCLKFSWQESARRAIAAFEAAASRRKPSASPGVWEAPQAQFKTAFLPAPSSVGVRPEFGSAVIYADKDCTGVSTRRSLARFIRERDRFDRVVIELADQPYCAETLKFAATGAVDVVLRDLTFGSALRALTRDAEGRELVVSMLYRAGGYHAVQKAIVRCFSAEVLGELVNFQSIAAAASIQVIPDRALADGGLQETLAWRDGLRDTATKLAGIEGADDATEQDWSRVAAALAANVAVPGASSQWLVDISNLFVRDAGTGIQRVVRHVLDELIMTPPSGYRVEPVCLGDDGVFRYARSYCQRRYFKGETLPPDEPVQFAKGDVYLGLDLVAHLIPAYINVFRKMRNSGVRQYFVLYDLLPVLRPDCFEPHLLPLFRRWYESVAEVADGIVCISRAVADEFEAWLHQARPERQRSLGIGWFHLGADLAVAEVTHASSDPIDVSLVRVDKQPTFLMVGTIEPRKGHAQTLAAFDRLWAQGTEANLLIIGRPGWLVDDLLLRIREHPQLGKRLFWFEKAGDDLLLAAYHRASALIMASEGEGFGLPLIEAAHHGLPLITRDLPVFREIAGEHAYYFSGYGAEDLGDALHAWLQLDAQGQVPQSNGMQWKTWREATAQLVDVVHREAWIHQWMPGPVHRYGAFDYRFQSQIGQLTRGHMATRGDAGLLIYGPYVPLHAGHYLINIYGKGNGENAWMDVCSSLGAKVHAHQDFSPCSADAEILLVQTELTLSSDVSDLEIRVGVGAGTNLMVREIEIRPFISVSVLPESELVI